jgi:hypothetical protein
MKMRDDVLQVMTCEACGATGPDVVFPVWLLTPGESHGTMCARCDEAEA